MENANKKIMFVMPNHTEIPGKKEKTGVFLPTLMPYLQLREKGFKDIHFVSVRGGTVTIDEKSREEFGKKEPFAAVLKDPKMMEMMRSTTSIDNVHEGRGYHAIIFVGGLGTLWDFHNEKLGRIAYNVYQNNGVVAAIDTGTIILPLIKSEKDQRRLIDGKRVTCISDEELRELDVEFSKLPRRPQDLIKKTEAKLMIKGSWEQNVIVEERLVTSQNYIGHREFSQKIIQLLQK